MRRGLDGGPERRRSGARAVINNLELIKVSDKSMEPVARGSFSLPPRRPALFLRRRETRYDMINNFEITPPSLLSPCAVVPSRGTDLRPHLRPHK